MSYMCRECHTVFEEPDKSVDYDEAWGRIFRDEYYECPYCGSSDFDDEYTVEQEIEKNEKFLAELEEETECV